MDGKVEDGVPKGNFVSNGTLYLKTRLPSISPTMHGESSKLTRHG